jgi:hypothetical protein
LLVKILGCTVKKIDIAMGVKILDITVKKIDNGVKFLDIGC